MRPIRPNNPLDPLGPLRADFSLQTTIALWANRSLWALDSLDSPLSLGPLLASQPGFTTSTNQSLWPYCAFRSNRPNFALWTAVSRISL